MYWIVELIYSHSIAQAILVLAIVAAIGLGLGNLKFGGVGLGIAGVLFAGIGFGHVGISIDHDILEFVREFGLVIFVFTIGMEVGPGFFTSFLYLP
jgi:putative transport protein